MLLEIENLRASIEGKEILKGINLNIPSGEVHAIMGPNGSGKSTLSSIIAGKDGYDISGSIRLDGQEILDWEPEIRSRAGIFLAFQYPVELPGVGLSSFLRACVNERRKYLGEPELDASAFLALMREKAAMVELSQELIRRPVNQGFSGGEKKRNEIFQMAMLEPRMAILDETDSGLDIDALRIVAEGVNKLRHSQRSMLVITHYQRLLEYIIPDRVHVLMDGAIVMSGDRTLALTLEEKGYDWIRAEQEVSS
ncbi:MAG: Fe-S cluster assembly ATPase SufC [Bacteroidia bacterium]|jgi:Fe-S cluster assembly ATP-binding protein